MKDSFFRKMRDAYSTYKKSSEQCDLKNRLIENEKWFRMLQDTKGKDDRIPASKSGFLFNAIITKHADAMDNRPDINILPREEGDKKTAEILNGVIPYILERCDFDKVYSDNWYSKLKTSSCYGVSWDPEANSMLGEIKVSKIDLLNLFWQPSISDIEDSEFVFYHSFVPAHEFKRKYGDNAYELAELVNSVDTYYVKDFSFANETVLVIDCYYKVIKKGKKPKLHFAKFSGEYMIFSSEDEVDETGAQMYPDGYYKHGVYPFFFDYVYPAEQSVSGFGYCDVMKPLQDYIDSLDSLIQVNNRLSGKPRLIVSKNLGISPEDLSDMNKEILMSESEISPNMIYKFDIHSLPPQIINVRNSRIAELKEIVGNRDFQQGGTSNGVTSGTALSVLQSVGDKLSRDIIQSSYRCYKRIILCIIELIRQFYTVERTIRITGKDGDYEFVKFDNSALQPKQMQNPLDMTSPVMSSGSQDLGVSPDAYVGLDNGVFSQDLSSPDNFLSLEDDEIPYFDVKLSVQKTNPYSRELTNHTILELASRGLFDPTRFEFNLPVLRAIQFEGKEAILKELSEISDKLKQTEQEKMMQEKMMQEQMMQEQMMHSNPMQNIPAGPGADMNVNSDEMVDITELLGKGV